MVTLEILRTGAFADACSACMLVYTRVGGVCFCVTVSREYGRIWPSIATPMVALIDSARVLLHL